MSCQQPICRIVQCPVTDDLPSYFGDYSLQNGVFFTNNVIVIQLPGGGTYTYPPDQIEIVVPDGADVVSYAGCRSIVSRTVTGLSQDGLAQAVAEIMHAIAEQQSICDSITPVAPVQFFNSARSASCPLAPGMFLVGTLPAGVAISSSQLTVAAGLFSSNSSQAAANNRAQTYVNSLVNPSLVICGWWNTEQVYTCPDSTVITVPANTYFSELSQFDADQLALDFAATQCVVPVLPDWNALTSAFSLGFQLGGLGGPSAYVLPPFGPSNTYEDFNLKILAGIYAGDSYNILGTATFGPLLQGWIVDYNGPGCNSNLELVVTSNSIIPDVTDSHIVTVDVYNAGVFETNILSVNARSYDNTTSNHPFSVPDTGGITKQLVFYFNTNLTKSSSDANFYQFTMRMTLTNV